MKVKVFTIVAIIGVSLLGYYLFTDLREMRDDINKIKQEVPAKKVKSKPRDVPKAKPKPKKKVTEKGSGKKHYRITYGRAPDVVSQPHFVPKDKKGYYQDPVTKRWYWEGD